LEGIERKVQQYIDEGMSKEAAGDRAYRRPVTIPAWTFGLVRLMGQKRHDAR
jgi:hypothetical protein